MDNRDGAKFIVAIVLCFRGVARAADEPLEMHQTPESAATISPVYLDNSIDNPADESRRPQTQPYGPFQGGPAHPWEMPPITVVGQPTPELREERRVGSYAQPVWTTDRRFAETRIYVRPEGAIQFEYWFIPTVNRKGKTDFETQYELEFGLPGRIQLDLYLNPHWSGSGGSTQLDEAIEFRYALANWGVLWGNPTLYIEFTKQDGGPDQLESKILFGGEVAPRWHWGWDLTYQRDLGGNFTNTYETTAGISYTLLDSRFDLGGEAKIQFFDVKDHRGPLTDNIFVGPSIQYRPFPRMHVDVAPLIGVTHESPAIELYLVVGYEF